MPINMTIPEKKHQLAQEYITANANRRSRILFQLRYIEDDGVQWRYMRLMPIPVDETERMVQEIFVV